MATSSSRPEGDQGEPPGLDAVRSDEHDLGHSLSADQGRGGRGAGRPCSCLPGSGSARRCCCPWPSADSSSACCCRTGAGWLVFACVEIIAPWLLLSEAETRAVQLDERAARCLGADHRGRARAADRWHRPLNATRWAGLLVGLGGVALLAARRRRGGDATSVAEVLLVALCYATGPLIASQQARRPAAAGDDRCVPWPSRRWSTRRSPR